MTSPWTATRTPLPAGEVVVSATLLTLRRKRDGLSLLRATLAVRRALLAAPGALGVSLQAHPWRGEYRTLSTWTDEAALRAFVGTDPHRRAMARWRGRLTDARVDSWRQPAAPVPWWDMNRARPATASRR